MTDIPLAEAMVIWSPDRPDLPPVKVVGGGDREHPHVRDDKRYSASWGRSDRDFNEADDATRLTMLFNKFVEIAVLYEVPAAEVHKAFLVIPEYRAAVDITTRGLVPDEYRVEAD